MGTLQEEIAFFNAAYSKVQRNVTRTLYSEALLLRDKIASTAPVRTGRYQNAWRFNKATGSSTPTHIASVSIFNPLSYATALEDGVNPSLSPKHPWVVSYEEKKNTGGLVKSKGVIWSAQRPGGSVDSAFTPAYTKTLAQSLADSVIEVF